MDTMPEAGKNSVEFYIVSPSNIPFVWERAQEILLEFECDLLKFHSMDGIYKALIEDKIELWVGLEKQKIINVGITQLCGEKNKYVEILWVGGKNLLKNIDSALNVIEHWGAFMGAKSIIVGGRVGWSRALEKTGFSFHRLELKKTISYVKEDAIIHRRH